jgi:hypothetical protein
MFHELTIQLVVFARRHSDEGTEPQCLCGFALGTSRLYQSIKRRQQGKMVKVTLVDSWRVRALTQSASESEPKGVREVIPLNLPPTMRQRHRNSPNKC